MGSVTTTGDSQRTSPGNGSSHRLLLVADELFRDKDLALELENYLDLGREPVEVMVISPAIAHNRLDQELGNVDGVVPEAADRMAAVIAELNESGFRAWGKIGDSDPLVAIGDGLAEFAAEEIVVVAHVDSEADPAEKGIWDRLSTDFHQPVTLLRVAHPSAGEVSRVVTSEHAPAHTKTEEEVIRETRNVPPFKKRDLIGVLVGLVGTVALGMIAVAAGTSDEGSLSGSAAAILLIAIAAFLINVAHVVGLIFFESVRYTGTWEKFMARSSMVVTALGLTAALVLWLA